MLPQVTFDFPNFNEDISTEKYLEKNNSKRDDKREPKSLLTQRLWGLVGDFPLG